MSETETNGVDRVRELLNGHVAAGPAKEPRLNHDESDGWDDGGFYNATKDPQSESDGNSASDHEEPADERTRGSADDQRTGAPAVAPMPRSSSRKFSLVRTNHGSRSPSLPTRL